MTKNFSYAQLMADAEHASCFIEALEEQSRQADALAIAKHKEAIDALREASAVRKELRAARKEERKLHRFIAIEDAKAALREYARKARRARLQSPICFTSGA